MGMLIRGVMVMLAGTVVMLIGMMAMLIRGVVVVWAGMVVMMVGVMWLVMVVDELGRRVMERIAEEMLGKTKPVLLLLLL